MKARLRQDIDKAIVEGVRRNGERIFSISQDNSKGFVAVDRGILRQSGYTRRIRGGIEIGYKAPYSSIIENGMPESYYKGNQVIHVRKHRIKGGIWVKAHDKIFVNKRLMQIRSRQDWSRQELEASYGIRIPGDVTRMKIYGEPIFVIMDKIPARKGQFFLTRAVLEGIKKLPEDLMWSLKRIGDVTGG